MTKTMLRIKEILHFVKQLKLYFIPTFVFCFLFLSFIFRFVYILLY